MQLWYTSSPVPLNAVTGTLSSSLLVHITHPLCRLIGASSLYCQSEINWPISPVWTEHVPSFVNQRPPFFKKEEVVSVLNWKVVSNWKFAWLFDYSVFGLRASWPEPLSCMGNAWSIELWQSFGAHVGSTIRSCPCTVMNVTVSGTPSPWSCSNNATVWSDMFSIISSINLFMRHWTQAQTTRITRTAYHNDSNYPQLHIDLL